jgi:hypothetical protein
MGENFSIISDRMKTPLDCTFELNEIGDENVKKIGRKSTVNGCRGSMV